MSNIPNNDINNIIINYLKEKSESSCIPKGLKTYQTRLGYIEIIMKKYKQNQRPSHAKRKNKIQETQK